MAQPLVKTDVQIANGPYTVSGAAGLHDVVYAATQNDGLYAIDAESGQILWYRSFLDVNDPYNNQLSATSITAIPDTDTDVSDISPTVGITGTPVIDPTKNIMYLVDRTKQVISGNTYWVEQLQAIDITTGGDAAAPFLIGTTDANGNDNTPIYVYGDGFGSVTDPYNGTGQQVVQFNALVENQRSALSLVNNTVYVDWAVSAISPNRSTAGSPPGMSPISRRLEWPSAAF